VRQLAKIKGIVLQTGENQVVVLEDTGAFKTRRWKKNVEVGQEISWTDYRDYVLYFVIGVLLLAFSSLVFYLLTVHR
jgi:hypothetical protein